MAPAPDARPSRRFDELTDPEIAAALARSPRVILPMGSVEQHGPHLPTGTDFFAATAIADEVAEHHAAHRGRGLRGGPPPVHRGLGERAAGPGRGAASGQPDQPSVNLLPLDLCAPHRVWSDRV